METVVCSCVSGLSSKVALRTDMEIFFLSRLSSDPFAGTVLPMVVVAASGGMDDVLGDAELSVLATELLDGISRNRRTIL